MSTVVNCLLRRMFTLFKCLLFWVCVWTFLNALVLLKDAAHGKPGERFPAADSWAPANRVIKNNYAHHHFNISYYETSHYLAHQCLPLHFLNVHRSLYLLTTHLNHIWKRWVFIKESTYSQTSVILQLMIDLLIVWDVWPVSEIVLMSLSGVTIEQYIWTDYTIFKCSLWFKYLRPKQKTAT